MTHYGHLNGSSMRPKEQLGKLIQILTLGKEGTGIPLVLADILYQNGYGDRKRLVHPSDITSKFVAIQCSSVSLCDTDGLFKSTLLADKNRKIA